MEFNHLYRVPELSVELEREYSEAREQELNLGDNGPTGSAAVRAVNNIIHDFSREVCSLESSKSMINQISGFEESFKAAVHMTSPIFRPWTHSADHPPKMDKPDFVPTFEGVTYSTSGGRREIFLNQITEDIKTYVYT